MPLIDKQLTDIVHLPGPEQVVQLDVKDRNNFRAYLEEFFTSDCLFYDFLQVYDPNNNKKLWVPREYMPLHFERLVSKGKTDWINLVDQANLTHSTRIDYSEKPTIALLEPKITIESGVKAIFFGMRVGGIPQQREIFAWEHRTGLIYVRESK